MKLAINAISAKVGGGRTYLINLLREIPTISRAIEIEVVLAGGDDRSNWPQHSQITYINSNSRGLLSRVIFEVKNLKRLANSNKWDYLLCPNGIIPSFFKNCKTIVVIQNQLIWDKNLTREFGFSFQRLRHWLLRLGTINSLKKSDRIIYVSNYIKDSTENYIGKGYSKISKVIYLGLETVLPEDSKFIVPANEKFLFYPSPFFPYKRQHIAVEGFEHFCRNHPESNIKLLLIGHIGWLPYFEKVKRLVDRSPVKDRIILLPAMSRGIIEELYQRAQLILFPSVCESISLILLEALQVHAKVICSNTSVMPEIGKDLVTYFEPDNSRHLAIKIAEAMKDGRTERGSLPVELFSWRRHTQEFLNFIRADSLSKGEI